MWLFCEDGFFSIVQDKVDKEKVCVRARSVADIRRFARAVELLTGISVKVITTPKADYLFRVVISKRAWKKVAGFYAESIEYDNFKEHMGEMCRSKVFMKALHDVWTTMWLLQYRLREHADMRQCRLKVFIDKKTISPEMSIYQDRVADRNYKRYKRSMDVRGDLK